MADVLDQSEVDALLAAVGVSTDESESSNVNVEEFLAEPKQEKKKEATLYDFKRPERVSKDQMRALEGIHEAFARNYGAALSTFLGTIVKVAITDTEQLTYGEFISSLPNPTCMHVLNLQPGDRSVCLEISPLIIFPFLDKLLGGSDLNALIPQRPLTSIEQRLVGRIIDRAINILSETWITLGVEEIEVGKYESNPHLVQIIPPNEVVVVITFEIKFLGKSGTMSLCIPFTTIEPVMEKLATQSWLSYKKKISDPLIKERIIKTLKSAKVNLRALLAETTIKLGQLMELQVGDIIQTEKPANAEIIVQVEGKNKFAGKIAQFKGKKCIRITRFAKEDERI